MSYVEIKILRGREYKYERRSYRVGDKVKHTSKYLGPVDPEYKTKKRGVSKNGVYQIV